MSICEIMHKYFTMKRHKAQVPIYYFFFMDGFVKVWTIGGLLTFKAE